MNPSRRQLYALGEPFGECCTRRDGCRIVYGGGSSSSKSSSATSTTTNNVDRRLVNDSGSIGISSDGSAVTINSTNTDMGAVKAAIDLAQSQGHDNLDAYKVLMNTTVQLAGQAQNILKSNVDLAGQLTATTQTAYKDAASQAQGNKNLVYAGFAVVGIAAVFAFKGQK